MLEKLAEKAAEKNAEFVTLFYGEDVTEEQAGQAAWRRRPGGWSQ